MENSPIDKLAYLLPLQLKVPLEESIIYAQVRTRDFDALIGGLVVLFIIAAVITPFILYFVFQSTLLALAGIPAGFFVSYFLLRSVFFFVADGFNSKIEKVLPDLLLLMAANLRAGMIPESSFLASIKPEFGKLNALLNNAAVETQGGKSFKDALLEMAQRTNSAYFRDSIRIIAEGIRSGAELHSILENLADNLLQNESIRNDMKAQVRSYSLFIFLAACIAAPLLYGVASFLITILDNIGTASSASTASAVSIPSAVGFSSIFSSFSLPNIPQTTVFYIAMLNVIITTVSSALLNGILNSGRARDGLKYIPAFLVLGLGIFLSVRTGVQFFFASSNLLGGSGGGGGFSV